MGIAINEVFTQLDGNWENWEGRDPGANYTLNQISFDLYSTAKTLSTTPIGWIDRKVKQWVRRLRC